MIQDDDDGNERHTVGELLAERDQLGCIAVLFAVAFVIAVAVLIYKC